MFNLTIENTIEKLKTGDKIIIISQNSDSGITFERGEITEIYNSPLKSICAHNHNSGYDRMLELNQFVLESELSVAIETNNSQLECDLCGEEFYWRELSHFSGFVDEKYSNHIHVCEKCKEKYRLFEKEIEVFRKV